MMNSNDKNIALLAFEGHDRRYGQSLKKCTPYAY